MWGQIIGAVAGGLLANKGAKADRAAQERMNEQNNDATWAPIDLTGASVSLRIRELGSTTVKSTLTCAVTDATGGKVATDFPAGTLDTAGTFEAELEITFAGGGKQTVNDLIKLKVRSDFD